MYGLQSSLKKRVIFIAHIFKKFSSSIVFQQICEVFFTKKNSSIFRFFLANMSVFQENWHFFVSISSLARSFFNISQRILVEGFNALLLRNNTYGITRKKISPQHGVFYHKGKKYIIFFSTVVHYPLTWSSYMYWAGQV